MNKNFILILLLSTLFFSAVFSLSVRVRKTDDGTYDDGNLGTKSAQDLHHTSTTRKHTSSDSVSGTGITGTGVTGSGSATASSGDGCPTSGYSSGSDSTSSSDGGHGETMGSWKSNHVNRCADTSGGSSGSGGSGSSGSGGSGSSGSGGSGSGSSSDGGHGETMGSWKSMHIPRPN
ncbi:hypothetical protein PPL_00840 [Heterostelium album PN500]|uniref:Uncharacterized protein n=1 Tax=Heterostelium pallidum (strain ATCC 26659 / Pp 5 / PN500) TaxID=670386 RepID=D3AXK9_HETP5|nr:hypothetical protein PPL_00840 [Heterostelium album PN500]EFA86278.1 hypothetical protein PPL_00840 [Heterostelium album PN500]|eukprot:XP_020438383.1 hypothetical protein PPL_00840 [Heterostelium album PN500]